MNNEVLAYINANVHKIAQFRATDFFVFIEFVNGEEVAIHAGHENSKLIVERL